MDIKELEEFILTADGKQWLEARYAENAKGLKDKNGDLLSELKTARGRVSEVEQSLTQTQSELSEERAALSKYFIDDNLSRLLKNKAVYETLIPSVLQSLKDTHGITLTASGLERKATGKLKNKEGQETEATLEAIVDAWAETADAKQIRLATSTGGGATGSNMSYRPTRTDNPTREQLANMSDAEFRQWQQGLLNKQ